MTKLERLEELGIKPIETVIIGRCEGTEWMPMILKAVNDTFEVYSPDGESWNVEMIAPLSCNRLAIGTMDDVWGLCD